jgi:type IV pilus assembly protein PilA
MYKNRSQGFTLIELLVVIAIIGILSAVVLASLNTARTKGADAAIQSDLATIQTQAEIYYGDNSNAYGGAAVTGNCTRNLFAESTITKAINGIKSANGNNDPVCNSNTTQYAIAVGLMSKAGRYWCVDSTGFGGERGTALGANYVCPGS